MINLCTPYERTVNLDTGPLIDTMTFPLSHQDALADVFRVRICRGMTPVDLTGASIRAYLYHAATRQTMPLTGEASGNTAVITLTEGCYATPGPFSLVIQVCLGGVRHTVLRVNGEIEPTIAGQVIDPGQVLPDLPALLAEIDNLRSATEEAHAVADAAVAAITDTAGQAEQALLRAQNAVVQAADRSAPAIFGTLEGFLPKASDAADNRPLKSLRLFGNTAHSQDPGISTPAVLQHTGSSGSLTIRIGSRNLFPAAAPEQITFTAADGSRQTSWGHAVQLPTGMYTIRAHKQPDAGACQLYGVINNADGTFQQEIDLVNGTSTPTHTLYLESGVTVSFLEASHSQSAAAAAFAAYPVQLLAGQTAAYINLDGAAGCVAVTVPDGLHGIPTDGPCTYSDDFGTSWIADELDLTAGLLRRRIGCIELDGVTPGRMADSKSSVASVHAYVVSTTAWGRRTGENAALMTSHYPYRGTASSSEMINGDFTMLNNGSGSMYIGHSSIATLAAYNAWLAAQHAAGTPVTILYELAEPAETPLSEAEAAAAQQLRSIHPMTTVNAGGAWIHAEYLADTKAYIDATRDYADYAGSAEVAAYAMEAGHTLEADHADDAETVQGEDVLAHLARTAPCIACELSGALVSIEDAAARPVERLVSRIEAAQAGTGDPSPENVRAITGWDAATLTRTGKNLIDIPEKTTTRHAVVIAASGNRITMNGTSSAATAGIAQLHTMPIKAGRYMLSGAVTGSLSAIDGTSTVILRVSRDKNGVVDAVETRLRHNTVSQISMVVPYDGYVAVHIMIANNSAVYDAYTIDIQLEAGDTATSITPPVGHATLTAALPETIYGGMLDWMTGMLTVTHKYLQLDGSESGWSLEGTNASYAYYALRIGSYGDVVKGNSVCSHYPPAMIASYNTTQGHYVTSSEGYKDARLIIRPDLSVYNTLAAWKTYLAEQAAAGTPVQIVYQMTAPYTIQLTPRQLDLLKGSNHLWSDCGSTDVTYIADTKLYIDQRIAAIAAAVINA